MRWTLFTVALVAIAMFSLKPRAQRLAVEASTAVPVEPVDLIANADLVMEARVESIRTLEGPGGRIDTEYVFSVARTFWGAPLEQRVVRLPGGFLPDGRGMVLPGVPHFSYAEQVLLALSAPDPDGMRMPIGLDQGCYRLRNEPNGDRVAWRGPATSARIDPSTGQLRSVNGAWGLPYGELAAELIVAAEARRAGNLGPTLENR